jgi:UDP-2-acetamido-3-amino-2,3-dideoxy-glucuronate N-acetyltransferase
LFKEIEKVEIIGEKVSTVFIHGSADVSGKVTIGQGSRIWNNVQIRENASIGDNCILSKNVYIDADVHIGNNVKIQNNVSVYHGVTLEDGIFVGPHVCFTNDKIPRAITPEGHLKSSDEWTISETLVERGASIGANATILPGIRIGSFSMIGAGSVVTKDIPNFGLVVGNPARLIGYVCKCGNKLQNEQCTICAMSLLDVKK